MIMFVKQGDHQNGDHGLLDFIKAGIFALGLIIAGQYLAVQLKIKDRLGARRANQVEVRTVNGKRDNQATKENWIHQIKQLLAWIREITHGVVGLLREVVRDPILLVGLLANFR